MIILGKSCIIQLQMIDGETSGNPDLPKKPEISEPCKQEFLQLLSVLGVQLKEEVDNLEASSPGPLAPIDTQLEHGREASILLGRGEQLEILRTLITE